MTGMMAHSKTESWLTLAGQVAHCGADYSAAVIQVEIFPTVLSAFGLSFGVLTRAGMIAVP